MGCFMCQSNKDGIQDLIEVFARVLGKEPEDEVPVSLQLRIFSPIAAVGFCIGQVLRSVQFNDQSVLRAEEVDFHTPVAIKRDRQIRVQDEAILCCEHCLQPTIEECLAGASSSVDAFGAWRWKAGSMNE
jgi:hypothetical protein